MNYTEAPRLPIASSRDLNAACSIEEVEAVRDAAERRDRGVDVCLREPHNLQNERLPGTSSVFRDKHKDAVTLVS